MHGEHNLHDNLVVPQRLIVNMWNDNVELFRFWCELITSTATVVFNHLIAIAAAMYRDVYPTAQHFRDNMSWQSNFALCYHRCNP